MRVSRLRRTDLEVHIFGPLQYTCAVIRLSQKYQIWHDDTTRREKILNTPYNGSHPVVVCSAVVEGMLSDKSPSNAKFFGVVCCMMNTFGALILGVRGRTSGL